MRAYLSFTVPVTAGNGGVGPCYIFYPRLWSPIYQGEYQAGGEFEQWFYNNTAVPDVFPQTSSANSVFEKARIGAFSVRITPIANATNDQGSISFALIPPFSAAAISAEGSGLRLPFGEVAGSDDIACTLGTQWLLQHPITQTVPFRHGATAYWRPQDPNSFTFQSWFLGEDQASSVTNSDVQAQIASTQAVPFIAVSLNSTSGTPSVQIEVVLHLEATIASEYDGIVSNGSAPHVIPAATALTGIRQVFGGANEKSGHAGTVTGMIENRSSGGSLVSQISSAVNTAMKVGGDVVGVAKKFGDFGSSLLSMVD